MSLFLWGTSATLISLNSTNSNLTNIYIRIGCIGVAFSSPLCLHVTYLLTNTKKKYLNLAYFQAILFSFLLILGDSIFKKSDQLFQNNYFLISTGPLYLLWFSIWFTTLSYQHLIFIKHYLTNRNSKIQYVQIPFALAFIFGSLNFLYPWGIKIFEYGNFGIVLYCLLVTYFIFYHQKLIGIEIVYRKGLLYSVLISIFTSIYLLLIVATEWLFRGLIGYKSIFLSLSSAFILAILFNPLRNKLQFLIDRIFLGKTSEEFAHENELLKQELERSERLKVASSLALGLAHEIKNPLTTIKTFSEFLPEKYNDEEFVAKFSRIMPAEVDRINNIVSQLLQFSKPAPPNFREISIYQLIQEILIFLNSEFLKHRIRLFEVYENKNIKINTDPDQIKQALLNILLNAIDAMPSGGSITVETQKNNDSVEISISDTGCGMDGKDLPCIFDPFFSKKESGTGLGLAITHQIIKNHGGSIKVKSKIKIGTVFTIKLPAS